ncbi:MAG TPA: hypothetical protein VIL94_02920 [Acidothermaceae bacterium]
MSNGFDYFGNALPQTGSQQAAAGTSPYASVSTFAPPPTTPQYGYAPNPYAPNTFAPNHFGGPASTFAPGASTHATAPVHRSRRPLVVLALVVIAAGTAAGISLTQRAHPIALPSTLAGLPKADAHSIAAEIKSTKKKLSQSGIHNVSIALYGDDANGSQGLGVIAGHTASTVPDMGQLVSAMSPSTQIAGVSITPSAVTSGSETFQCQTIAVATNSMVLCEWQTPTTLLFGIGQGLTTSDTAAALDDVIGEDQLH